MSAETLVSDFIATEYAASGIEVRGSAPGLVTVAMPYHVEDVDDFVGRVRDKFDASVDLRATEQGVELDIYPHSLQSTENEKPARRFCDARCLCMTLVGFLLLANVFIIAALLQRSPTHSSTSG